MFSFLKWIFGTAQERTLSQYKKTVHAINASEHTLMHLSDEELFAQTFVLRERFAKGETLDQLLVDSYAVIKNCCRRLVGSDVHVSGYNQKWDMIPYDVQLLGAIALHHGAIAESQTGEGKTLTAVMPLYLHSLTQKPVHIVTVNDYLAQRDCEWVGTVLRKLHVSTGVLQQGMEHNARKAVYQADVVYGTASEFGFDYLRDNSMAMTAEEQVQRGHAFALIDEADSILIDEARTPLIISGPSSTSYHLYDQLQEPVAALVQRQRDECQRLALDAKKQLELLGETIRALTEQEKDGCHKLWLVSKGTPRNKILKKLKEHPDVRAAIDEWDLHYYKEQNKDLRDQALAQLFIVVDERANEFELTERGSLLWSDTTSHNDDFIMLDLGYELSAIDQEDLSQEEKMAKKLAMQEEDRTRKERAHNLRQLLRAHLLMEKDVDYIIQDNKIVIIDEHTGRMQPGRRYSDGLHQAIEAKEGVPIQKETQTYATITLQNYFRLYTKISGMTGTAITEAHEFKEIYSLSVLQIPTYKPCQRKDLDDEMYMTEREKYNAILAEVKTISAQGRPILLGTESVDVSEKLSRLFKLNKLEHTVLNAKNHAKEAEIIASAGHKGAITIATNMAGRGTDIKLGPGVVEAGGLHVIGSTRHQSRRIDRQLRGRSGRLGDPGSSKFYISLEDPLMRLFASAALTSWLQRFRPPEGEPIRASILNKSIETAQKRVEARNYSMRKHTLEYDDVMNKQRQEIYLFRQEILHINNPQDMIDSIVAQLCQQGIEHFLPNHEEESLYQFRHWLATFAPINFDDMTWHGSHIEICHRVEERITQAIYDKLAAEERALAHMADPHEVTKIMASIVRSTIGRSIDTLWQRHLLEMDHLRSDVHFRAVGQKDPLIEFKHEAFRLFDRLTMELQEEIVRALFHFYVVSPQELETEMPTHTKKPLR